MSDGENEEEGIRRRKMSEQQRLAEAKKAEEQLKATLRVVLDENAYDRLTNVKLANAQLFLAAAQHVLAAYKRIGRKIKDEELLAILRRIKTGTEKQTRISFERK